MDRDSVLFLAAVCSLYNRLVLREHLPSDDRDIKLLTHQFLPTPAH